MIYYYLPFVLLEVWFFSNSSSCFLKNFCDLRQCLKKYIDFGTRPEDWKTWFQLQHAIFFINVQHRIYGACTPTGWSLIYKNNGRITILSVSSEKIKVVWNGFIYVLNTLSSWNSFKYTILSHYRVTARTRMIWTYLE